MLSVFKDLPRPLVFVHTSDGVDFRSVQLARQEHELTCTSFQLLQHRRHTSPSDRRR